MILSVALFRSDLMIRFPRCSMAFVTKRKCIALSMLDGEVISAPIVNQVPLGKQFIIEGFQQPGEVQNLAYSLMNPLEFPLVIQRERPGSTHRDAK